jgi:hypothetical protein
MPSPAKVHWIVEWKARVAKALCGRTVRGLTLPYSLNGDNQCKRCRALKRKGK